MTIAVVIETKARACGPNTLRDTLCRLRETSAEASTLYSVQLVCGGEHDTRWVADAMEEAQPIVRLCPDGGVTRQQNAARAIRFGAQTDADWVLKLEDDLDFVDDFIDQAAAWLTDHEVEGVPMYCLGATFEHVSDAHYAAPDEIVIGLGSSFPRVRRALARGASYADHQIKGWYGAQAIAFRRAAAEGCAEWLGEDPALWDGHAFHRDRGHDLLLQMWGQATGATHFRSAIPSFVQHVGRHSTLSNAIATQPFFEFPFPGRAWRYEGRREPSHAS